MEQDLVCVSSRLAGRCKRKKAGQTFCEGDDGEIDGGAHGGIIVQRDKRIHFKVVEESLDEDESRCFELWGRIVRRRE